jgi:hypothetical protein
VIKGKAIKLNPSKLTHHHLQAAPRYNTLPYSAVDNDKVVAKIQLQSSPTNKAKKHVFLLLQYQARQVIITHGE